MESDKILSSIIEYGAFLKSHRGRRSYKEKRYKQII